MATVDKCEKPPWQNKEKSNETKDILDSSILEESETVYLRFVLGVNVQEGESCMIDVSQSSHGGV